MQKVLFDDLEETRLFSGWFVRDLCDDLGITERTYYRWKREGYAPKWVSVALYALCGKLDHLGWKGFYIRDGKLYSQGHHPDQYCWSPGQLLEARFWELNKTPATTYAQQAWRNQRKPATSAASVPDEPAPLRKAISTE